ncbi:MAG TPA: response regulator [Aquihabitans sp.]|nr:response regulator [Aquihabitans sp.]
MNPTSTPTATSAWSGTRRLRILLVEDDPGDVLITTEALADSNVPYELTVVEDGEQALDYLNQRGAHEGVTRPDLILLDLNLPRVDGREVLAEVKAHPDLASIPVIILSTSDAEDDVLATYQLHANAYVTKPVDFDQFHQVVRSIDDFFLSIVRLPKREG